MTLKFIDLFAGIGGMRIAFERAGASCVYSSEWDQHAQKTYFENHGDLPNGDIQKVEAPEIPPFDLLVGGFPCQPFSTIGLRQGFRHLTQGTLFFDVARIIEAHRPAGFLLENVPGLESHDGGNTWKVIKTTLETLGYQVYWKILDSSDFGLPQKRKRIYIVGTLVETQSLPFEFPAGDQKPSKLGSILEQNPKGYSISKHLQENYIFKKDDGRPQVLDASSEGTAKTLVASYHKIQRLTGTFVSDGPTGLRLLSELECKRLMGFPEEFEFPVSRTQMYRQLGNSVAIPVVEAIARRLVDYLQVGLATDARMAG